MPIGQQAVDLVNPGTPGTPGRHSLAECLGLGHLGQELGPTAQPFSTGFVAAHAG